ncbi:MAG: DUF1624 domain-containing protein [Bacteroidota bacterium]
MTISPAFNYSRVSSIDFLRGVVMILMVLDHTRDYFHADALIYDPLDLSQTTLPIFLTRFITHFCAPVFVFLAGTSAFFVGQRRGTKSLSIWLVKRGIWLIIAELTIIKFAWMFKLNFSMLILQVIWVLGVSMIFLAAFIHVPKKLMIVLSLLAVFGHNLMDNYQPQAWSGLWGFLHVQGPVALSDTVTAFVAYPMIPWIFVMALGYHFGSLYTNNVNPENRKKFLYLLGLGMIVLFVLLRSINIYGNLDPWIKQDSIIFTILSFIDVTKYPPSLDYLLITLGPSILLLAFAEKWSGKMYDRVVTIGRVPMFLYIIHIYVIHLFAGFAAAMTGFSFSDMILDGWVGWDESLNGYGFSLPVTYLIWAGIIIGLYPICKRYYDYKRSHRDQWWLSYL